MFVMQLAKMAANVENLTVTLHTIRVNELANLWLGFEQSPKREPTTLLFIVWLTPTLTVGKVRTLHTVLVLELALRFYKPSLPDGHNMPSVGRLTAGPGPKSQPSHYVRRYHKR